VIYPDTSFLVSIYVDEEQTALAHRYLNGITASVPFTPFHRLEVRTALRLRVFRNELTPAYLQTAFRQIDEDLSDGILRHTPLVWADVLREAERLAEAHLTEVGVRSGDLLHVASAVVLGANEFLTFDRRQTELARRAGLKVKF